MESLVAVILLFVAIALGVSAFLVISNRRQMRPYPIDSEVRVPQEVRDAVRRKADAEARRPKPQKRGGPAGLATDEGTPFAPVEPLLDVPPAVEQPEAPPPGVAPVAHRPLSPGSHVPLVDALVGMQLPCDLLFLSNVQAEPGVREVMAFVTTSCEAEVVARGFADELERLDYDLVPGVSERDLVATRADITFKVTVHSPAGSVLRSKAKAFPTAPDRGVVVELSRS
jgi:hypothetical protein